VLRCLSRADIPTVHVFVCCWHCGSHGHWRTAVYRAAWTTNIVSQRFYPPTIARHVLGRFIVRWLLQSGFLQKRLDTSSWISARKLRSTYSLHCVVRKFRYLQNKDTYCGTVSNSERHVDRRNYGQLSSTRADARRDKLDRPSSVELSGYLRRSKASLSHWASTSVYKTPEASERRGRRGRSPPQCWNHGGYEGHCGIILSPETIFTRTQNSVISSFFANKIHIATENFNKQETQGLSYP